MKIMKCSFLLLLMLFIAACGGDKTEPGESTAETSPMDDNAGEVTGTASETPSEAEDEVPDMSEFLATNLHEVEPAAPGMVRMEVAGEVLEVGLDSCWISEGEIEDRFEARANWQSGDGRHFDLVLRRLLRHDEFFWGRSHGYEFDQVSLRLHDGSGHFEVQDRYAASGLQTWRDEPGSDPIVGQGTGELPVIRIVPDGAAGGLQVTAVGELHEGEDYGSTEYGTPLTGPFTLAMNCE